MLTMKMHSATRVMRNKLSWRHSFLYAMSAMVLCAQIEAGGVGSRRSKMRSRLLSSYSADRTRVWCNW